MLTVEYIRGRLSYEPDTGLFYWKSNRQPSLIGKPAGCVGGKGYSQIRIHGRLYQAHRLAWFYHYGDWPNGLIDHINGRRTDNRLENLRVVSPRGNKANMKRHREGGLVGATYNPRKRRWQARVYLSGKYKSLGYYASEQEAHEAYVYAVSKLSGGTNESR